MKRLFVAIGCAGRTQQTKLDDSGLSRLNEQQMQPVDDARVELGRRQDMVSKAKANESDARARVEVAKSERDIAEAQVKRAAAQRELLKKQYADAGAQAQADADVSSAQDAMRASELKLAYMSQNVAVAASERNLAEAKVQTQAATIEQTKYQAMKDGGAPQTASINPGELDARMAQARSNEAQAARDAANKRTDAVALYDRWEKVDARARLMSKPQELPQPQPSAEPTVAPPQ
jgi:hypothetical protein